MSVAARFHKYCKHHGIDVDKKLPYGAITSFMTDHIVWTAIILQGLGPRRKGTTLTQAALLSILLRSQLLGPCQLEPAAMALCSSFSSN